MGPKNYEFWFRIRLWNSRENFTFLNIFCFWKIRLFYTSRVFKLEPSLSSYHLSTFFGLELVSSLEPALSSVVHSSLVYLSTRIWFLLFMLNIFFKFLQFSIIKQAVVLCIMLRINFMPHRMNQLSENVAQLIFLDFTNDN